MRSARRKARGRKVRKYQLEQRGILNNPHRNSFQPKPRQRSCATLATNVQQPVELLTSIASLLEVTGDTANRELKTGLGRLAHGLLAGGFSFSASRHG
jgi:hypothetical protein